MFVDALKRDSLVQVRRALLALIACLFSAQLALGQTGSPFDHTGFQANRDYLSLQPWESIDTATGNVILSFTDLELPGNGGRGLRFRRVFNGMGMGSYIGSWRFSVGDLPLTVQNTGPTAGTSVTNAVWWEHGIGPKFEMPDGALKHTTFMMDPVTGTNANVLATTRWVQTQDFWRFERFAGTLYLPDGRVAQYDGQGRLIAFDNGFSDTVTLAWNEMPGHLIIRQTLAGGQVRTVDVEVTAANELPTRMTYEDRVWRYVRDGANRLGYVQPPMGNRWEFTYDSPTAGRIKQVKTPQGGIVDYVYDSFQFITSWIGDQPQYTWVDTLKERTANSLERTDTWRFNYVISGHDGPAAGMTASLPDGSSISYSYVAAEEDIALDGWMLTGHTLYDTDGVTPLEGEAREYVPLRAARPSRDWYSHELRLVTVSRGPKTYTTQFVYNLSDIANYHDFHHPFRVVEYGDELSRITNVTYEHHSGLSPYVVGLRKREETTVGDGATMVRSWTYDPLTGFRLTETAYGVTTAFTPETVADAQTGNAQTVTRMNGHAVSLDHSWGVMASSITSAGVVTTRAINPNGTVASETVGGRTTGYTYDRMLREITRRPPGSGAIPITTTPDDVTGRAVTVTRGPSTVVTTLDGFGRPIRTENTSSNVKTRTAYDGLGRVTYRSYPFIGSFGGSADIGTSYTYDGLGRVLLEKQPDESTPGDSVRQHVYDGDEEWVRDVEGRWTRYSRKGFGDPDDNRLTGVLDATDRQWTYQYDTVGNLVQVTSPDDVTRRWMFDPRNLLVSEEHPESGLTRYTSYDPAGVLKEKQDANGNVTRYEHDDDDRVTEIKAGAKVTTFAYEPGSNNRRSSTTGAVETRLYYDDAGRLGARDDVIEGRTYTRRFEYDALDNLRYLRYPSGRYVEYNYDGSGRVTSVNDLTAGRSVASGFGYHPSGGITGYQAGNGLTTNVGYKSNRYWVNSISVGPLQLGYEYYPAGNIKKITDNTRPDRTQEYTYDELDRLRTTTSATLPIETFEYDAHGNRIGGQYDYWDNTNRLRRFDIHSFTYDGNGNLKTVDGNIAMNYTPDNAMSDITVGGVKTEYVYDSDMWRALKAGPGSATHFLRGAGGELLTELTDTGTGLLEARDYVYAGSRVLAVVTSSIPGSFCRATLTPTSATLTMVATSIPVTVTVAPGCPWTATSTSSWATITGGASGSGSGTVTISIASNTEGNTRFTQVMIAGRAFGIEQAGAGGVTGDTLLPGQHLNPGEFLISQNGFFKFIYEAGGALSVRGTDDASYWWNRRLDPGGVLEMQNDGNLVVYVGGVARWDTKTAGNPGARLVMQNDRNAVLYSDPGLGPVEVLWASYSQCLYTTSTASFRAFATGTSKLVALTTEPGCPWVASSPVPWITVSPASGTGEATLTVTVAAHGSVAGRVAAVTIGGQEVVVEQGGAAGYVGSDRRLMGERLWPGQSIKSPNGLYELTMWNTGLLRLIGPTGEYLRVGSTKPFNIMEMLADGTFAVIAESGTIEWKSSPPGGANSYLRLRDDGVLAVYTAGGSIVWQQAPPACTWTVYPLNVIHGPVGVTSTLRVGTEPGCLYTATSPVGWISIVSVLEDTVTYTVADNSGSGRSATITVAGQSVNVVQGGDRGITSYLDVNQELYAGQMIMSPSGDYELVYQGDGNLVLYGPGGVPEWDIRRGGTSPGVAIMQGDGNFVVYNSAWDVMFQTGTAGHGGATIWLQDDGNLVIYESGEPIWDRFSAGPP
jgi:YD repeat-containing protein